MAVVTGAGAVLERDLGFGFVRQLFEPVVARAPEPERHRLMGGAARLAAPIVMLRDLDPRESPTVDQPAALHGLYWVLANMADRVPLLVVVDDIQWADTPSLRLPRLEALINRPDAAARALAMVVAGLMASRGYDMARVLELVTRGVDGGRFLRDEGPESLALPHAVGALLACDELDTADRVVADVLPEARRRGSVVGFGAGSVYRLWIDASRGQVDQAAGHLRAVIDLSLEHDLQFALPTAFLAGVDVLLERPDFDDAAALAESIQLEPALAASVSGAWVIGARGRLRGLRGEREAAIADLRSAGETFTQLRLRNPIMAPWRSPLALLLPRNLGGRGPRARGIGDGRCSGSRPGAL
jgi:hypothetical protein